MDGKQLKCPNCGAVTAAKDDGTQVCSVCGGSFTFRAGEHKLTGIAEFDALKADVDELKKRLAASVPAAAEAPEDPAVDADDGGEPDDEEEV